VELEEIDVVGAQALQAAGDAALERGRPPVVAPGALEVAALGEQVDIAAPPGDGLADERLRVAVALGGVDDVEAGLERVVEQPPHRCHLDAIEADLGPAKPQHADVQLGPPERAPDHRHSSGPLTPRDAGRSPPRPAATPAPPA
jgi:hypothetical protein